MEASCESDCEEACEECEDYENSGCSLLQPGHRIGRV